MLNFVENYSAARAAAAVATTDTECAAAACNEEDAVASIIATPARTIAELAAKLAILREEIARCDEEGEPLDGRLERLAASALKDAERLAGL